MSDRWFIREYHEGDEARIVAFFNRVFEGSWDGFEPRKLDFWRWQFSSNPAGHHTVVAEDERGRLIGSYAGIRTPFLCDGERIIGSQAVDTCVDATYRGTGLFIELTRAFYEQFGAARVGSFAFGYPNQPAFRVGTKHLRYEPVSCPVRKIVLDFDSSRLRQLRSAAPTFLSCEERVTLDERVDSLWDQMRQQHSLCTWRDRRYLHWRYETHPSVRYRFIAARNGAGQTVGLVVFRLGWFFDDVVPLVDWLVPRTDPRVLTALVATAAEIAVREGYRRVETWLPPRTAEHAALAKLEFVEEETDFNLVVRINDPPLKVDWMGRNWFYTMGDTDFY